MICQVEQQRFGGRLAWPAYSQLIQINPRSRPVQSATRTLSSNDVAALSFHHHPSLRLASGWCDLETLPGRGHVLVDAHGLSSNNPLQPGSSPPVLAAR